MDDKLKDWLFERVRHEPEFVKTRLFPALEKHLEKAHLALHEAYRSNGLDEIKYRAGWFDGVQETLSLLNGLRMSESKPPQTGLVSRSMDYIRQLAG